MTTIFVAGCLDSRETGYGVHASDFLDAMRRVSSFPVEALNFSQPPSTGPRIRGARPSDGDIVIVVGNAEAAAMFEGCAARKICFTVWESTRIPDSWHRPLAMVDEVWTATEWGADVLRRNGIDPHRTHVVPEGVDGDIFNPDDDKLGFVDAIEGFKFLHVGKAEPRKGTFELLQAFDRAFDDDDPVHLVLACHNRFIPGFDTVRFIENLCLRRRAWIVPVQPLPERTSIAGLYRACDAFLAPSKAEGWGLTAIEAMACGLPTALTHYSGHTAFADQQNSLAVPFEIGPIEPGALPQFFRQDEDYGEWAVPDIDGLAEVMRSMVHDRAVLRERALLQSMRIRRKWTWDAAAASACERIAALLEDNRLRAVAC